MLTSDLSRRAALARLGASALEAFAQCNAKAFEPGALWPGDNGVHINAHGGGLIRHEARYNWFGEHKIAGNAGNRAEGGVHV